MGHSMIDQLLTTGIDIKSNAFVLGDGSEIGCSIYDTNGTDRYKSLNETFYKKADGCLLVYDITNRRSFDQIKDYYIPKIKEKCHKNIIILLLGNKKDMKEMRKVSWEEGNALALENNYIFKEASCIENENVFDTFQNIIENTFNKKKNNWNNDNDNISLISNRHKNLNKVRKTKCC